MSVKPKPNSTNVPNPITQPALIRMRLNVGPMPPTPNSSRERPLSRRWRSPERPCTKPCRKVVIAIRPSPPIRIKPASTTWPSGVSSLPTSMMESPVTVIAEVTVNRASHRSTLSFEQRGVANTRVPAAITSRPVTTVNWGTVSRFRQ